MVRSERTRVGRGQRRKKPPSILLPTYLHACVHEWVFARGFASLSVRVCVCVCVCVPSEGRWNSVPAGLSKPFLSLCLHTHTCMHTRTHAYIYIHQECTPCLMRRLFLLVSPILTRLFCLFFPVGSMARAHVRACVCLKPAKQERRGDAYAPKEREAMRRSTTTATTTE